MIQDRVSVIIPVYNIVTFLRDAINSVISQDYGNTAIIVVNDGSNPEASREIEKICSEYDKIFLIRQNNKGQALARFEGIKHAKGEYIIFLDADDILLPGAISYLVGTLKTKPGYIASYATKIRMDEKGNIISNCALPTPEQAVSGDILPALLKGTPLLSNGNICIRRNIIELINFPRKLKQGEDWVTWCRLALLGPIIYAGDKNVLSIRCHDNNTSNRVFDRPSKLFKMLNYIYNDKDFISYIGAKKILEYRRIHTLCIHIHLHNNFVERKQNIRALKHKYMIQYLKARQ